MSDTGREVSQEIEQTETLATEQLSELGSEQVEDSTQEAAEETLEQVSINDLVGETQAQDEEQKERNRLYAENRVKSKQLKELKAQVESGQLPPDLAYKPQEESQEPQLVDFQSRLYDDFDGDTTLMSLAYNEALRKYDRQQEAVSRQSREHVERVQAQLQADTEADAQFVSQVEALRGQIPEIDESLIAAERLLGVQDFEAIRKTVGSNAPLVLGVIGADRKVQAELAQATATGDMPALVRYLTRLEDKIVNNMSRKTVSKATGETPLAGGSQSMIDYDAEIIKVMNDKSMTGMERVKRKHELEAQRDSLKPN